MIMTTVVFEVEVKERGEWIVEVDKRRELELVGWFDVVAITAWLQERICRRVMSVVRNEKCIFGDFRKDFSKDFRTINLRS